MISGRFGNLGIGLVNSANAAVIALTNLDVKLYPVARNKRGFDRPRPRCMRAWAYANLFWMFGHWWEADDCCLWYFIPRIRCPI